MINNSNLDVFPPIYTILTLSYYSFNVYFLFYSNKTDTMVILIGIKKMKFCLYFFIRGDFMEQTTHNPQKHIIFTFLLIYILNCMDLLFTYTYLKTGIFVECNPIMRLLLNNTYLTIFAKLILPAVLVIFLFFQLEEYSLASLKLYKWGGIFLTVLYTLLNVIHLYYFFQFFFISS